jgi:hypothetical protein
MIFYDLGQKKVVVNVSCMLFSKAVTWVKRQSTNQIILVL